jgi:hypothetical protein
MPSEFARKGDALVGLSQAASGGRRSSRMEYFFPASPVLFVLLAIRLLSERLV